MKAKKKEPIIECFRSWLQGKFIPYENEPDSPIVRFGGYYERPCLARVLLAFWNFSKKHWQWLIGTILLGAIAIILALPSALVSFRQISQEKKSEMEKKAVEQNGAIIPRFTLMIRNGTDKDLAIDPIGEFYLSLPDSPVSESIVATGRFQLGVARGNGLSPNVIVVQAGKTADIDCAFLNPNGYVNEYKRGDLGLRLVLSTKNGHFLEKSGILFNSTYLMAEFLVITVQDNKT